ncbi:AaceriAGL053Cp [[Ashbya] aceris (nom. inval.)]|nr:AaceriAGL053Cp [[Ashbya] aceris (nom. inval.)]
MQAAFRPLRSLIQVPTRGLAQSSRLQSGHNKWSTIKHDKAKNDAERNRLFTRMANQISVAVKLGGSADPALNLRLAAAIEAAAKANVTKKVIENAIRKGSGEGGARNNAEPCMYEAIGPGGVAFVLEALTDNKNRTVSLVRAAFNKHGGNMSPAQYFFDRRGYVAIQPPASFKDYDAVFEVVSEVEGVEDLELWEEKDFEAREGFAAETYEVKTEPTATNYVATVLKERNFFVRDVGIGYLPKPDMMVEIADAETDKKHKKLLAQLDEIDDLTEVYMNLKH